MLTAFLSRTDVARHVNALHLLNELRAALTTRTFSNAQRHEVRLPDFPAWAVVTRTPARQVLQLHDSATGHLLAVMDALHLTTLRASVVGALAVDVLARADAKHVAVLGAGAAASSALKALRLVRSIEHVWLFEADAAANFTRAHALATSQAMAIAAVDTEREAVAAADIIVLAGGVYLNDVTLRAGAHVSVLNAGVFNRPPLSPDELRHARAFCDAPLPWADAAPLPQVLRGTQPGRRDADDVTLFASSAADELDLVTAWHVYEGARHDETLTRLDLEM